MNHLREFGLSRDPFSNDLAESFYYESPMHRAAERRVLRSVEQHKGLCLLVGPPGVGKSLVARRVLEGLEEEAYEASLMVLLQSGADVSWLLSRVATQFGVEEPGEDAHAILPQIYERLSVFSEEGRRAVLIVDDAHLLASAPLMEVLRALVDLEYEERQLLSLILLGEPELDAALGLDPRLLNRLDVRVGMQALDLSTAAAYLGHRITASGGHPSLLEPDAVEVIHRLAGGVPRRLNVLADNALFEAHLAGRTRVVTEDVEHAAGDLGYRGLDLATLADGVPSGLPGGEPIDLTNEVSAADSDFGLSAPEGAVLSAFEDDSKEEREATFFDTDSPATVVMGQGDRGVEGDVDDLFENLMDKS